MVRCSSPNSRWVSITLACALGLLFGWLPVAQACTVPVFRYALERWEADPYEVMIFHRGKLDEATQQIADKIRAAADGQPIYANIRVELCDLDSELDKFPQEVWDQQQDATTPWMVVFYPFNSRFPSGPARFAVPLWSGQPDAAVVERLVDSPARREVARRLIKGQSAVFVLVEIGNPEQDEAAAKKLTEELARLKKDLKLPELAPEDAALLGEDAPPLAVDFSLVRVSREKPEEKFFVDMLLGTEPDLRELKEPMAFPIFGRGRALYALVGAGINQDNLDAATGFLCGECSCQIKTGNPGVDLLMSAGWANLLEGSYVVDEELPPLTGLPDPAMLVDPADTAVAAASLPDAAAGPNDLTPGTASKTPAATAGTAKASSSADPVASTKTPTSAVGRNSAVLGGSLSRSLLWMFGASVVFIVLGSIWIKSRG